MTETLTVNASAALVSAVSDLDIADAAMLRQAFEAMFSQADEWVARAREIRVTGEDQKREMKLARESRLALREIRINAERRRKELKEDSLRRGRAIDGLANVIKGLIEPIEEYLLEQETFADRAIMKRRDALRDARATALRALNVDPAKYADLGAMTDETWDSIRTDAELAEKARKDENERQEAIRVEAERIEAKRREDERQAAIKAEAERVAREKQIADENAKLRADAEQRERAAAAERTRLKEEQDRELAKVRADAEARELSERAERERAEAAARADREKAAKAEAELAAERERKALDERARHAEEARRAAAPDREKLLAFAEALRTMTVPAMTTARGQEIASGAAARLQKLASQIDDAAAALTTDSADKAAE